MPKTRPDTEGILTEDADFVNAEANMVAICKKSGYNENCRKMRLFYCVLGHAVIWKPKRLGPGLPGLIG